MFQHTGQHIKRRFMCCPELEEVTLLPQDYPPQREGFQPVRNFDEKSDCVAVGLSGERLFSAPIFDCRLADIEFVLRIAFVITAV